MTDTSRHAPLPEMPEENSEQRDEDSQAQTVADDAILRQTGYGEDSDRAPGDRTQILPDDTPDLIDRMEQMVSSGHIDTDAFAGEPFHDDEESLLGPTDDDEDLEQSEEQ